jgi:hypothetical protein
MTDLMTRPIRTELSERTLRFEPGGQPTTFEVIVHNESDRFASFQVELEAPGVESSRGSDWYRLSPSVSSKIPEGDNTRFWIEIFGIPPVPGGFSGVMRLTVKTYSPELEEDDKQDLKLTIEGDRLAPPQLQIQGPNPILVKPKSDGSNISESVSIEVLVQNPNHNPSDRRHRSGLARRSPKRFDPRVPKNAIGHPASADSRSEHQSRLSRNDRRPPGQCPGGGGSGFVTPPAHGICPVSCGATGPAVAAALVG